MVFNELAHNDADDMANNNILLGVLSHLSPSQRTDIASKYRIKNALSTVASRDRIEES